MSNTDMSEEQQKRKIRIVEASLEEIDSLIEYWSDKKQETYGELTELAGACGCCYNWHYPHCNPSIGEQI